MKGLSNTAAAACTLLLLCQCASQDEVRRLNYQLRSMNQKVQTVESKTEEKIKEVESKATDKQLKETASSTNRLEEVAEEARQLRSVNQENIERFNQYKAETEDKISSLYAAIEQMQSENGHLSKSNQELVRSLELKIEQLSSGLEQASQNKVHEAAQKAREAELRAKEAADKAAEARRKADMALRTAAEGGKVPVEDSSSSKIDSGDDVATIEPKNRKVRKTESAPVQQPDEEEDGFETPVAEEKKNDSAPVAEDAVSGDEGGLFDKSMGSFKEKNYKKAYKSFEQYLSGQPSKKQAAKTLYLMGECLFNQGEYDLAILEYQKVISNYSDDSHSSAALLRQAMSFEKLTDKETAKIIYGKLASDYPDSREAKVARERMENLRQP
ncbi:MAG: tol-pal system protein YbgF [Candidatus Electronema aureum]|uniref:Tol-pal system protein YbgF n=1 Tax=Candidatus Electronema aureum TaxID=2005002 RepID=A0A521G3I4_9BACT|nr:MAG: tol-pal system protein YbgF [Candidatus Electronema aureum]